MTKTKHWIILTKQNGKYLQSFSQAPTMVKAITQFENNLHCPVLLCVEAETMDDLKGSINDKN